MITLRIKADVQTDRRVVVTLPPESPTGPAELVVTVDSPTACGDSRLRTGVANDSDLFDRPRME